jgi:hypothetical protein
VGLGSLRSRGCLLAVFGTLSIAGCGGESASTGGGFCDSHRCIASFGSGTGSVVRCADDMWSHSGGRSGACSHHGGVDASVADSEPDSSSSSSVDESPAAASAASSLAAAVEVSSPVPSAASLRASAKSYVTRFYESMNISDYRAAWKRMPPAARSQAGSFARWKAGYRQTMSSDATDVSATMVGQTSGTVTLTLRATDLDACADEVHQRFAVTWDLTRTGGRWAASSIDSTKISGRAPAMDATSCDGADQENLPTLPAAPEPSVGFCEIHDCIENFDNGTGTIALCADGMYSHSGGNQGACSGHGGRAGGALPRLPGSNSTPSYRTTKPSTGGTVHVDGYTRKDGTYVRPYTRRAPCSYC